MSRALDTATMAPIRSRLRAEGFRPKGLTFARTADGGNAQLIQLQTSRAALADGGSKVRVNYGVHSTRLARLLDEPADAAFDLAQAHWISRSVPGRAEDGWILFAAGESPASRADKILRRIDDVLLDLQANSTDEVLTTTWSAGRAPGITAMQRLIYLAVMLNDRGAHDSLVGVLAELRALVGGRIQEESAVRMLERGGVKPWPYGGSAPGHERAPMTRPPGR